MSKFNYLLIGGLIVFVLMKNTHQTKPTVTKRPPIPQQAIKRPPNPAIFNY